VNNHLAANWGKYILDRLAILCGAKIMVTDLEMLNFMFNDKTHSLHTLTSVALANMAQE